MFDDEAARRALHTLTDEDAPPVTTTLDQVLRRGKRRVVMQRVSAVAGVVAVVAAIGVGAMLLRPGDQGDTVRAADKDPVTLSLDGWELVKPRAADGGCPVPDQPLAEGDSQLLSEQVVQRAFFDAIKGGMGAGPLMVSSNWQLNPPEQNTPRGLIVADVSMPAGSVRLQLEAGRFGGTPQGAADWWKVMGECEPPYRLVQADGTVLQLYPARDYRAELPMQQVQVFQPTGRMYTVSAMTGIRDDHPLIDQRRLAAMATRLATELR